MTGLSRLQSGVFWCALATLIALFIDALFSGDAPFGVRVVTTLFLVSVVWISLSDGVRRRGRMGFIHVYVGITAFAWATFALNIDTAYQPGSVYLTLISLLQNQIGVLVMIWVFARLAPEPGHTRSASWVEHLAEVAQRLPQQALGAIVLIYLGLTYHRLSLGLVMSGTGGVMATVGTLDSILLQLSYTVGAIVTIIGWFFIFGQDRKRRNIGILFLLTQVVFGFLGGRRVLLAIFVLGGVLWVALRGITLRKALIAFFLGAVLIGVIGPFFVQLRNVAVGIGLHQSDAGSRLAQLGEAVNSVVENFDVSEAFSPDYRESVQDRAGIFSFTIQIQERLQDGWAPRHGEAFLNTAAELIPRFLWPGKLEYLGELRIEQQLQLWFGLPLTDSGPTLLTFAIADGGALGVVLYYAGFGLLLALLTRFLWTARFPLFRFWAAAQIFALCFYVEESLAAPIGAARFLIAFLILDRVIAMVAPRLTEQHRSMRTFPPIMKPLVRRRGT